MQETLQFLVRHGYALLFGVVLAEQIGLPIPAIPILLGMGALAGTGRASLSMSLLLATVAAMLGDLVWYQLGRQRGHSVLRLLCRISLEPDSCVRRTENVFARQGARVLLFAKFIPGLSTVAPPLAGMIRMSTARFLVWDGGGTLLWVTAFTGAGYFFHRELEFVAALILRLGRGALVLAAAGLVGYIAWKYAQRQRFLRQLRVARITPEELARRMEGGDQVMVVDLRNPLDLEAENLKIRGSLLLLPKDIEDRHQEIPRDRDVVVYCSWPNEATSARVALLLHRRGITRVRPLEGGFDAWHALGYPTEPALTVAAQSA